MVWHDDSVPYPVLGKLREAGAILRGAPPCANQMLWRVFASDESGVDRFLVQDADSCWHARVAGLVGEWIASGLDFVAGRDHPHHIRALMGCMWGGKAGVLPGIAELVAKASPEFRQRGERDQIYGLDELWMERVLWPLMVGRVFQRDLCHADKFGALPWPASASEPRFCGEVMTAGGKPRDYDWMMRRNWQT